MSIDPTDELFASMSEAPVSISTSESTSNSIPKGESPRECSPVPNSTSFDFLAEDTPIEQSLQEQSFGESPVPNGVSNGESPNEHSPINLKESIASGDIHRILLDPYSNSSSHSNSTDGSVSNGTISKDIYPTLLIGQEVLNFKKQNRVLKGYPIIHFEDLNHVREVVSYYTSIKRLERPLIIEDLAFIKQPGLLLKFLEDSPLPIIALSLYDTYNPVLYSRFRLILKKPLYPTQSQFTKPQVALDHLQDLSPNTSYYDRIRHIAKYSPLLFYLESSLIHNKQKVYQFF